MTTTTRNEAAERLRAHPAFSNKYGVLRLPLVRDLDEALAGERRATVERITTLLCTCDDSSKHRPTWKWCRLYGVVLDEEAAR